MTRQAEEFTHLRQQIETDEYDSNTGARHPHVDDKGRQVSAGQRHSRVDDKEKQVRARQRPLFSATLDGASYH